MSTLSFRPVRAIRFLVLFAALFVLLAPNATANSIHTAVGASSPLQLIARGHALNFAPTGVHVARGSQAYHVEFVNPARVTPTSDTARGAHLSRVTYANVWRGITLTYDPVDDAILQSTYRLEPFADPAQIRLRYNAPVTLGDDGALTIASPTGAWRETAPIAWQARDGARIPVASAFELLSAHEIGFALGAYDPALPLFIDPTLTWNTFLGASSSDDARGIAVDASGNVYVVGTSYDSWGSPTRSHSGSGNGDVFAAKLDPNGALVWNTFLGGGQIETGYGIAVDANGNVYVTGFSQSSWGSPANPFNLGFDAFAAKLSASTGGLTWHTFFGGQGTDYGHAISADNSGNVYVTGFSDNTWGSPVRAHNAPGNYETFVIKLNSGGARTWNTFLGGSGYDYGQGIAVDTSGNVYVAGYSDVTWGAPVRSHNGNGFNDAYAAKLNSSGGLTWHTFLGDSGTDTAFAIVVDASGNSFVAGRSGASWGTPVSPYYGSGTDSFIVKLNSAGGITWNGFHGGSGTDNGYGIALDANGYIFVAGRSNATWGSPSLAHGGGGYDGYAARFDSSGNLKWNTFLGGSGSDNGRGIAVDGSGYLFVTGDSSATWGTPIRAYTSGNNDGFVAKMPAHVESVVITGPGTYTFFIGDRPVVINVNTQGTLGRINITRFNTNHPNATGKYATGYYWQIEGLDGSNNPATGFNVTLTLPHDNKSNPKACRYLGGGSWACAASASTSSTVTRPGVTQFSDWVVGEDAPTNVTLSSFNAQPGFDLVAWFKQMLGLAR